MAMTEALRQSILLGAVNVTGAAPTGPDGNPDYSQWELNLRTNVRRLTSMLAPESRASKLVDRLDACSKFVATVSYVDQEVTSKRGYVVLKSKDNKTQEDKFEGLRTDIVTGSEETKQFARQLRALTGHKVLVFKEMDEMGNGQKVRLITHVEDLGEDAFFTDADIEAAQEYAAENSKGLRGLKAA